MISVGTRDELKRAVAKAEDIIAVADPKLCYDFLTLRSMSIYDRRLLYLLEMKGYQMMAKRMLGQVEVKFVLDSRTAS